MDEPGEKVPHDDPVQEDAIARLSGHYTCNCDRTGDLLSRHTCPYAVDIHGDEVTLCTCCSDCEGDCAMDI